MFKAGDKVRWMCPIDEDYSYGTILAIKRSVATVSCTGYYTGTTAEVHLKYIERLQRGGGVLGSNSKEHSKRSATKIKL